jgi:TonB family protein
MLKQLLTLFISLILLQVAKAEKADSLMVYLNKSGQKVLTKDSADFYRVVLSPDTAVDKDLYRVYDYYPNGKLKRIATSFTQPVNLVLDGSTIDYYPNGRKRSIAQFKHGLLSGSVTAYYPNGKLYNIVNIKNDWNNRYGWYYNDYYPNLHLGSSVQVIEVRDSTGNVLAENGNGHVIFFDEDFKKILVEGDIKNNKKEGEWRGRIVDSGSFICNFHKDVLKSGISYFKSGHHYNFTQVGVRAVFSDGPDAWYYFIKKNLQYPESAKKHRVMGNVIVEFYVETNGTVSGVKVVDGLLKSLDDEAIRVVSLSPLWIPASEFGMPLRTRQTVTINFSPY